MDRGDPATTDILSVSSVQRDPIDPLSRGFATVSASAPQGWAGDERDARSYHCESLESADARVATFTSLIGRTYY